EELHAAEPPPGQRGRRGMKIRSAVARRRAGFTMIEVMISITLLALVAGICYAAFHLGIRAVGKGEMAVVTAQRLRAATGVPILHVTVGCGLAATDDER